MGQPAARVGDKALQSSPHCHAPIHPAALVPTPLPHPPLPLPIALGSPNVTIGGLPAARVSDQTTPCMIPACVPGGPGIIAKGSATVRINGLPAARLGDMTQHAACVAPIPAPIGSIIPPCCPTVLIGDVYAPASDDQSGGSGASTSAQPGGSGTPETGGQAQSLWGEEDIKKEWAKTDQGKKILKNLPRSTKFMPYMRKPGDKRNAFYSPRENAIYIPTDYTSKQAAPTAAHEAVHADQCVNHKRPASEADRLEMEVEAKNKGLDVYDQMGQPNLPYNYKSESDFRKKDQTAYDNVVRSTYRKAYNIK